METEPVLKNSGERETGFRQTAMTEQKMVSEWKQSPHRKTAGSERQVFGRRPRPNKKAAADGKRKSHGKATGKSTQAGITKSGKRMCAGRHRDAQRRPYVKRRAYSMRQTPGGGTPRQIRGIPNGRDISRGAEDVFLIECGGCHFILQGLQRIVKPRRKETSRWKFSTGCFYRRIL